METRNTMTITDEELRKRIALAKAAPWRGTSVDSATAALAAVKLDAAHIAANSPDAVIALCEELLAAREESARHARCPDCSHVTELCSHD